MNIHLFYLSLLALAVGFVGYMKFELDSNLEKFENGKQALSKNFVQLKETIKQGENDLKQCKKSHSDLESVKKETEETKKKLSDVTQSISTCDKAKVTIEGELKSLKDNFNKLSSEKNNVAQHLANCDAQKTQTLEKINQETMNSKQCLDLKTKCENEKSNFQDEYLKLKKTAEETAAFCQADKNNLNKVSGELQACQQTATLIQNERNQLIQTSNLCSGEKQRCENEKMACLQAFETARQQQQVPPQQQQQVPPQQQQQVPPQQQQQQQSQP